MTFRTNTLPLMIQTFSRNSDNVCARPMWQFVRAYLIKLTENVPLLEEFGVFAQRVDVTVLFFLQL